MAQGLREFVDKYGSEPKQPSMNEFVNQYGTNKKQGGKPSQQQAQPVQQQPTVYEQRKARQEKASDAAKKAWWEVLGLAAQDASAAATGQQRTLTAEEGRQRLEAGANLNAAIKENREANKVIEWDGRKELLKEYRRLDKIDNPKARQQAQEIREQLRQGDVKAGNLAEGGDMAYNFGDWTGRIVPGGVKNAAAGGYNALLTALDMNAKAQATQGPTEDELIQEWLTGQEPGSIQKQRQAGYESPEFRQFMNERYAEASAIKASAQRDLQIAKENQRPVVKAGVDIGENIIEMGADAAIAHLTGGSSLIPMAVRVFGSGAMDAREQGYSLEQQAAYGAAQAAIEVFTEKIGGIGGRGKGWSDALADKLVDELAQTTMGKNALRFLIAMAEEGGEEVLSDFMQPLANYAAGMKWDGYNAEEMLYDFFIGSVVGGMSSVKSMTLGSGNAAPQTAPQQAAQKPTEAPTMQQGAEIPESTAEAPTAAPVELNSQDRATETEQAAEAEQSIDERARRIYETPYEDEFYGTQQREDWESNGEGAKLWAYLEANGVDSESLAEGSGAESRAFYELLDLLNHGGDLPASAAAQAFAEAKANGKMNIPKIVSRAYEIAGKEMPSGVRAQYAPTPQDRADRAKLDESYAKGMASYFDTLAKKAEREGNTEYAERMRQRAAEERAKAKEAGRAVAEAAQQTEERAAEDVGPYEGSASQEQPAEDGLAPAGQSVPEEQSGTQTEVRDDTSSALQAPSPQVEGSVDATQQTQAQMEERAAEDVGPYEGEPSSEQPAEAPAPAQPAAKKTTATEATRKLQEKYGDGLRTQETRGKIQSLARQARETDFSDPAQVRSLWESAKQQAREILNTMEDPSARTGGDTGGEIRSYLRGQKIRIDERLRNDRPSEYESMLELRRKNFGTLNFSNTEGMTLDEVYQELGTMFGEGMFPQDVTSHSEIVERILNAVANEKGQGYTYEQSLSDAEYERAAADLAMELMRAAEGVTGTTIPTPVREAQQNLTLEQEREAAIESELDADFEGELTREDAERIVDERYEAYGEYDLDKILNGLEDNYGEAGEEADDFDEYAYYAERYRAADAENADEAADAGGTEELPETVGQGTPERGLAANEPAGVGEVRGPGSLAPDGEVNGGEGAAESGPEPGQKRSKTESHTLQNMAERLGGEQDELYYTPKSERESLANAINRVDADMGGEMQKLLDKEMWSGEDIDTALTIQGMLQLDGVQTGDFSAAQAWARAIQARGTESGRALQAFSKWTRSGAAAAAQSVETLLEAENLTEEDRTRISNDVCQFGRDYDSIEDGDLDGIRDLIKRQARYRNTWTFGKKGFERMLNEVTDFEWLKEYAMRQLMNIPGDYTQKADLGQKVKTWQVQAQLSRLGTFFRNIGGNGVFGIQDTLSQDFFGVALDAMLGKFTGKRTLNLDKGWLSSEARKGARQGLVRSVLEVAGDVDMDGSGNRYDQTVNRTFKMTGGALSRLMSRWEQLLGYSLTTSDRTFRGGIEAEQQRGLSGFENLTEEERQALAQNMADYRLFQNHGVAYGVSKGMHDIANLIGFGGQRGQLGRQGGFGAGDLLMPYPGVPANLGVKALEYSPLNVAKGLTEMVKLLSDAKTGGKIDVKKQQNAVMDMARGLHGTALLAGLAALFKAGLFKNADDEDDKDAKALASAEGRQGVQMNLSGILRYLQGGSAEWKDGDQLMKIDWLEPMNAFLAIASMAADENDLPGYVGATFDGTLQSILDMPVMESFSNIFDNYNYSKGETVREKLGDVAVGFAADALTGMLPAPVSQTARAMDPYYRETIGEDAADTALRRVMNAIPGLRQQLDPKLDNFGRPKEQASSAYNRWMNSFLRPGQISDYKLEDVDRALDEFAQRTGEAVYPDRKAPNSFSADGQKIQLSGEEKQTYQETYGQAALQYYGEILLGDEYRDASDGEKQWLLDQAEAYAAYQAKKAIMEQRGESYSNSSWDKVDALEEKGGDPFGYLFAKQSMKTATENKDYSTVDALLGDIDKMDKATKEQLFADVNRLDDRVAAHKAGIDTVLWEAAYAQKKKLEEDKNTTAVQDTISFAQWADSQKDLNRKQKDLLRDQMGFYTTFRADAEKFDKLTETGLSADKAGKVWNAINALQPMEGHAGVTQNQRLKAISSMGNLSDAEKWAVLEFYASESAYKKAMDAKAKGWTFDQWVQSFTKGK